MHYRTSGRVLHCRCTLHTAHTDSSEGGDFQYSINVTHYIFLYTAKPPHRGKGSVGPGSRAVASTASPIGQSKKKLLHFQMHLFRVPTYSKNPLIYEYTLIIGALIRMKVYSLIKGFWSLWVSGLKILMYLSRVAMRGHHSQIKLSQ